MAEGSIAERIKRLQQERDRAASTTRRFLWGDFLLVLLFLALALYFFWPMLFTGKDPYAPINTVNQTYRFMKTLQNTAQNVLIDHEGDSPLNAEQLVEAIAQTLPARSNDESPRWALLTSNSWLKVNHQQFWEPIPLSVLQQQPGMYTHSHEGRAVLIFVEDLAQTSYLLVVATPFPPLFEQRRSMF